MTIQLGIGSDPAEENYKIGIEAANKAGNTDRARELAVGLQKHRARVRERKREPPGIELHAGNSG